MKGKILDFNATTSQGVIAGEDGKRYNFGAAEWKGEGFAGAGLASSRLLSLFYTSPSQTKILNRPMLLVSVRGFKHLQVNYYGLQTHRCINRRRYFRRVWY